MVNQAGIVPVGMQAAGALIEFEGARAHRAFGSRIAVHHPPIVIQQPKGCRVAVKQKVAFAQFQLKRVELEVNNRRPEQVGCYAIEQKSLLLGGQAGARESDIRLFLCRAGRRRCSQ